ncbi:hypothetical protein IJ076_01775 [Candidatus Saccharibacteria bacterium]|nr:hypothetical protein [Candidatus Saccharibacteria bacterium]
MEQNSPFGTAAPTAAPNTPPVSAPTMPTETPATSAPTTPTETPTMSVTSASTFTNGKQKKGPMIAIIIMAVLTLCGAGFGIFGIMQSSNKDSEISNLKTQVANLKSQAKNKESEDGANYLNNLLANIEEIGDLTYGVKTAKISDEQYIYAEIDSNANLLFGRLENLQAIAEDVVFADFLYEGQAGESLYFIRSDGTVGAVKNATSINYDTETPQVEEIAIDSEIISINNIMTADGYDIVFIDFDGNFIEL